jgi:hypothetical protein
MPIEAKVGLVPERFVPHRQRSWKALSKRCGVSGRSIPLFLIAAVTLSEARYAIRSFCDEDIWTCRRGQVYKVVVSRSQNGNPE